MEYQPRSPTKLNFSLDIEWDNASSTSHPPWEVGRHLAHQLWIFLSPVIFVVGVCGNALILAVMHRRRLRGSTTSIYLRLMAIADVIVIVSGIIPEWLEAAVDFRFKELHPATCKMEKFFHYTSGDTSIFLLVAFSLDRLVAVTFPLEAKSYCTVTRAKVYSLGLTLLAVAKNTHVFWTRGAEYKLTNGTLVFSRNCGRPTPEFKYFEKFVRPWIAFALVSILPFCIICVCNIFIIKTLIVAKKARKKQASASAAKDRTVWQLTFMCLSASVAFLICITPSIVLLIGKPYWTSRAAPNPVYEIAKAINNQLTYVNHSCNFFLYCLSGERFRQELVNMCRIRREPTPANIVGTSGSQDSSDKDTSALRLSTRRPLAPNGNNYKYKRVDCNPPETGV